MAANHHRTGTRGSSLMREHVIRASYTDRTVRVYQAYPVEIARPALAAGRFIPPFKMERMTWIKPSFNWMMYRCGFGTKPGQEVVLAIDISREGFDWALNHAVLSSYSASVHESYQAWRGILREKPVRIQWDPERDWRLNIIDGVRAIQIGLSGEAVERYVNEWTIKIEDITALGREINECRHRSTPPQNLPDQSETAYPLKETVRHSICRE